MKRTKGNILVVDDEKMVRSVLQKMLTMGNYAVATAEGGQEALALLEKQPFDLVIVDLNMPQMNGHELIRRIHAIDEDKVVIILTGYASVEAAVEGLRAGAYDFLTKPIDMGLLFPAVERAIERYHLVQENRCYVTELEEIVAERTKQLAGLNEIHQYIATHAFDTREGLIVIGKVITQALNLERWVVYLADERGQLVPRAGGAGGVERSDAELPGWRPSSVTDTVHSVPIGADEGVIQVERASDQKPICAPDLEALKTFIEPIRLVVKFGRIYESLPQARGEMDVDSILNDIDAYPQTQ